MNTKVLKWSVAIGIASAIVGCNSITANKKQEEEKAEEAKYVHALALEEAEKMKIDSVEYAIYCEESEMKLAENDRKIESLKSTIKAESKSIRITTENALNDAKVKNKQLKIKLNDFQKGVKSDWESFKLDFNKDLDELGKSISAMAEKNMKKK